LGYNTIGTPAAKETIGANLNDGNWHHVAITYDPAATNGNNAFYIDGEVWFPLSFLAGAVNGLNTTANAIYIGRTRAGTLPFLGEIDEVRIWNRALPECEILNNYNCELFNPTSQTGLLAYYQFNQGSAGGNNAGVTTLNDASGNNKTGTLTNFALTGATSNWTAPGGVTTGNTCTAYVIPVPAVSIAADPGNSITAGTSVTFTATPTNGGTTPAYQWKKNGSDVGTNSATYTDAALANGDVISCVMTSNDPCASPTTATSNEITVVVSSPCTFTPITVSGVGVSSGVNGIYMPNGTVNGAPSWLLSEYNGKIEWSSTNNRWEFGTANLGLLGTNSTGSITNLPCSTGWFDVQDYFSGFSLSGGCGNLPAVPTVAIAANPNVASRLVRVSPSQLRPPTAAQRPLINGKRTARMSAPTVRLTPMRLWQTMM
jgi:hypothetical protein